MTDLKNVNRCITDQQEILRYSNIAGVEGRTNFEKQNVHCILEAAKRYTSRILTQDTSFDM